MAEVHGRWAVIGAMPMELRPLVKALSLRRGPDGGRTYVGTVGGLEVVAIATGIGTRAATGRTDALLTSTPVDHVVCIGIAGAVDARTPIGSVVVPEVVILASSGRELRPVAVGGAEARGKLHTSDEFILDPDHIARLAAAGVVALDMETAAIGAACERHATPWSVFRAISDRATDYRPQDAVIDLARPDGSPNLPAALRYVIRRPRRAGRLVRLARDAKTAAEASVAAAVGAIRAQ